MSFWKFLSSSTKSAPLSQNLKKVIFGAGFKRIIKLIIFLFYFSIRLAVVSEPTDKEEDCQDIGYAFVDINDILHQDQNYQDKELKCKIYS